MARPPEKTRSFRIFRVDLSPGTGRPIQESELSSCLDVGPLPDPGRMRDAGFCEPRHLDELWAQKARLDELFDAGQAHCYHQAREELYPAAGRGGSGGARRGNRAGEKLAELGDAVGGFRGALRPRPSPTVFVDVCGAPGSWSNYLFGLGEEAGALMRGYGFSLREGTNPLSCTWYEKLTARADFTALWGEDGTGDLCVPANVSHVAEEVGRAAAFVVADGGMGVGAGCHGEHLENFQEIVAGGVLLAEVLVALRTLSAGGCFVCKFFDTFTRLSVGLLFVLAASFEDVRVVKPRSSRVVNSERYVVARRFRGADAGGVAALTRAVQAAHDAWPRAGAESPWAGEAPRGLVPVAAMAQAPEFVESVRRMTADLCNQQAAALHAVVDRALELWREGAAPAAKRRRCGSHVGR